MRVPAHWLPRFVRAWPVLRLVLAPDARGFMSDRQKRQVGLLRASLWLPLLLAVVIVATVYLSPNRTMNDPDHG